MGIFDKFKKKDDDLGDFGDLGDFSLDSPGGDTGGSPLDSSAGQGMEDPFASHDTIASHPIEDHPLSQQPLEEGQIPATAEEVQPSAATQRMSENFGTSPSGRPAYTQQAPQPRPVFQPQQPDLAKDIEIIHAKLDSIRSSLDAINQRLATLERIASGDQQKSRYTW